MKRGGRERGGRETEKGTEVKWLQRSWTPGLFSYSVEKYTRVQLLVPRTMQKQKSKSLLLPVPEPLHWSQKTKEHARLPPTGDLRLPPGESWYQVFCILPSPCHCSEAKPGSGRRQEEPGQGRQVKDAPTGFPLSRPERHFPSLQLQ